MLSMNCPTASCGLPRKPNAKYGLEAIRKAKPSISAAYLHSVAEGESDKAYSTLSTVPRQLNDVTGSPHFSEASNHLSPPLPDVDLHLVPLPLIVGTDQPRRHMS